jgi:membrane protein CcdC involved in cytochrome C biogenesis
MPKNPYILCIKHIKTSYFISENVQNVQLSGIFYQGFVMSFIYRVITYIGDNGYP